jgi:hypothetical protein
VSVLLLGWLAAYAGVEVEADDPPCPPANTLEDDATSSPTTATHDKILFIGNLSPQLIGSVPRLPMQLISYSDSVKNRLTSKLVIDEIFSPHQRGVVHVIFGEESPLYPRS